MKICMVKGCGRALVKKGMCGRCYQRQWRASNPEKARATYARHRVRIAIWHALNPLSRRRAGEKYRRSHPEQVAARRERWAKQNPEKLAALKKRHASGLCANLEDAYVAKVLGMRVTKAPPVLLAAKRAQLKILRRVKELTK